MQIFWYPNVHAGVEGVRWVENCVRSADNGASWVEYKQGVYFSLVGKEK